MNTRLYRSWFLFAALLILAFTLIGKPVDGNASESMVNVFTVDDQLTLQALRELAQETHSVIGVSRELIGSDDKLISIKEQRVSLRKVLDDISREDPRYTWEQAADGSIQVYVGSARLTLRDVIISSVRITNLKASELAAYLLTMPEVEAWADRNRCGVGRVSAGSPAAASELSLETSNQPLWRLLDQIAAKTETYFWCMVKYSRAPCEINLTP